MKDRSVRCGIWLKKQGIGTNDIVVICSKNNLDLYAPIFGIFYTGAIFSGWNPFIVAPSRSRRLFIYDGFSENFCLASSSQRTSVHTGTVMVAAPVMYAEYIAVLLYRILMSLA